jgi:hypothetical protein
MGAGTVRPPDYPGLAARRHRPVGGQRTRGATNGGARHEEDFVEQG